MFGCVELMMGANHIRVRCIDGITWMGRITGKIKKQGWIREGDIPIVIPWNFQDEKCDIMYHYTGPQIGWLRRNEYLYFFPLSPQCTMQDTRIPRGFFHGYWSANDMELAFVVFPSGHKKLTGYIIAG